MLKARFLGYGSLVALALAGGIVALPSSRHLIRREIAGHTHIRFSTASATKIVPLPAPLPEASSDRDDLRFSGLSASHDVFGPLIAPRLDADALAPTLTLPQSRFANAADHLAGSVEPGTPQDDPGFSADLAGARQAVQLYRQGAIVAADDFARPISGPLRTTLDWAAVKLASRSVGIPRMVAFIAAHPDWPENPWIRRRIEEQRAAAKDPDVVLALFAQARPTTLFGRLALAKAKIAKGDAEGGAAIVRAVWRDGDLSPGEESSVLKEFGPILRKEDHKFRADRLLYKEDKASALRAAVLAGPDVLALARARIAVIDNAPSDAAIAAVPKPLQADPGLIFARIQKARRAGKTGDAEALLLAAPVASAQIIDGDAWWVERRLIARKLLDIGDNKTAYRICAAEAADSVPLRIEAEFHAGWIALRFMNDPQLAAPHFAAAAAIAETPISIARVAYWQARTAKALGDDLAATRYFTIAADRPTTFYGQIAAAEIGRGGETARDAMVAPAATDRQSESVRAVKLLLGLGEHDLAMQLALTVARSDNDPAQIAAAAQAIAASGDAKGTLMVGKAAAQHDISIGEALFPTFGIPAYQALANSADRSTVYAIARQESEFDQRSASTAGAKGVMQLISATARRTARLAGVPYDDGRLVGDAAFNAQLGAAHLGKLLADEGGSYVLTFAAYNAGAGKVHDWIEAYGDPRHPGIDVVDWIERIPFTETRNYVQRVFENMQIYRARFGMPPASLTGSAEQLQALSGKGT